MVTKTLLEIIKMDREETGLTGPMVTKTLLEIIKMDREETGLTGPITAAFLKKWREEHSVYGKWPLSTRFGSGSGQAIRGESQLERATKAWRTTGRPMPPRTDEEREAFNQFVENYRDEYDEEFYK